MEEVYYTIDEVAERLKVTRKAIYDWMRSGELGYVQIASRRRIPQSALSAFIKAGKPEEVSEGDSEGITIPGLVAA